MATESVFHLPTLSRWHKAKMLQHAETVLTTQQQMISNTGKNILHYSLEKHDHYLSMDHYPKGDRIDHTSGAQYFYHCHRENLDHHEHGHFHCFMRYHQIPKRIKPKALPDWTDNLDNPMTHLVAIAMDCFGQPIRLFTVNRWVTSEIVYDAQHIPLFIKRFKMTTNKDPYWQILDQWVQSLLHLFLPQITWLNHQRDRAMEKHRIRQPEKNLYADRAIEELSEISIDLKNQIQWILNSP
jgi:hypothetical protein